MTTYHVTCVVAGVLRTYLIYRLMMLFFDKKKCSAPIEMLSYTAYGAAIVTAYFATESPTVVAIANLIFLYALTCLYVSDRGSRPLAVFNVYTVPLATETFVSYLWGYKTAGLFESANIDSSALQIAVQIVTYIAVLVCEKYAKKKDSKLPRSFRASLTTPPAVSVFIIAAMISIPSMPLFLAAVITLLLLMSNIQTYYLYGKVLDAARIEEAAKAAEMLRKAQERNFADELRLMEIADDNMRNWEHDKNKHLHTVMLMAQEDGNTKIETYTKKLLNIKTAPVQYIKSGNPFIDGALNRKLMEARQHNISVKTDFVGLNMDPDVAYNDWTTIVGNLMENAVEATSQDQSEGKEISIKIHYMPSTLVITIKNTYTGEFGGSGNLPQTTKNDAINHGRGLKLVKSAAEQYSGTLTVSHDNDSFTASVELHVDPAA